MLIFFWAKIVGFHIFYLNTTIKADIISTIITQFNCMEILTKNEIT